MDNEWPRSQFSLQLVLETQDFLPENFVKPWFDNVSDIPYFQCYRKGGGKIPVPLVGYIVIR